MPLLSMRNFAKVNGISYYNVKKYIEDGIIHQDENGMIESGECIRILRQELQGCLKRYTVYMILDNQAAINSIRDIMDKEGAVEVNSFDDICIKYNEALLSKVMEKAEKVSEKYKAAVLHQFIQKYSAIVKRKVYILCENKDFVKVGLTYKDAYDLAAYGIFPKGYEYLKGSKLENYIKQDINRVLLKCDTDMNDYFDKTCKDLNLFWDISNESVLKREELPEDFLKRTKDSELYKVIKSDSRSFVIGEDNALFKEIASNSKTDIKPTVLAEFAAKRFYHMVVLHDDMSYEDQIKLVHELMLSNCNECLVCGAKDKISRYIPSGVMLYLDTMQYDWRDRVIYIGDIKEPVSKGRKSGVVVEPVETMAEKKKTEETTEELIEDLYSDNKVSAEDLKADDPIKNLMSSVG